MLLEIYPVERISASFTRQKRIYWTYLFLISNQGSKIMNSVFLITSRNLNDEEVKETLKKAIPDFDIYLEKKQIEPFSCVDLYLKEGNLKEGDFNSKTVIDSWVDKFTRALTIGYAGLRTAENFYGLEKESWRTLLITRKDWLLLQADIQ